MTIDDAMEQEVWITIRLKGSASIERDVQKMADALLADLQARLEAEPGPHGFTICQPGDVMEIEEEADIYDFDLGDGQ